MPNLYKLITAVLALTGCISLFLTGELNPVVILSGVAILPGYYRFLKGMQPAPKWAIGIFSGLTLLVFFADFAVISGEVFLAVAHLTIAFQAIKSFDLKEPWDHLQVYFMALLQLIIASDLTQSPTFGVIFVIFMVLLVTAMVLSNFLKEGAVGKVKIRNPVLIISLCTLLMTTLIFILLPRSSHKLLGENRAAGTQNTGFSEKVDFGAFGEIMLDPKVVMRVEMDREVRPLYWRGLALDYFDGVSWQNTAHERASLGRIERGFRANRCKEQMLIEQKIFLEPISSDIIFGLAKICNISTDARSIRSDPGGSLYLQGKSSPRIQYSVYSAASEAQEGVKSRKYLQLPDGTEQIKSLAVEITAEANTEEEKARIISDYLQKNYIYSLSNAEPADGLSPVEDFLFHSRKGYCEHFATSMVLMLRALEIPSRVVNGYYGGEKNEYGGYIIVRQSNAHSWVEALIDGKWKRFDPTPAGPQPPPPSAFVLLLDSIQLNWARYVVGFSLIDQRKMVKGLATSLKEKRMPIPRSLNLKFLLYSAAAGLLSTILFWASHKMRAKKYGFITDRYLTLKKKLVKKGIGIKNSMTPGEIKQAGISVVLTDDLEEFLAIYEEHRFGQTPLQPETRTRYELLLKKIAKNL
jgi:protein-glutamine gamma-glutamyltransferase